MTLSGRGAADVVFGQKGVNELNNTPLHKQTGGLRSGCADSEAACSSLCEAAAALRTSGHRETDTAEQTSVQPGSFLSVLPFISAAASTLDRRGCTGR